MWFFYNFRIGSTHRPGLCPEDVVPTGQPRTDTVQQLSLPKDRQLFVDVEAIRDYACRKANGNIRFS